MPNQSLLPALRAALRMHEIGTQSPYRLYFAGKGKSGASFGFMQGDLAAGQPLVRTTFNDAMTAAGIPGPVIASLSRRLSVHLLSNPLTLQEREQVNAALLASRTLVDKMDNDLMADIGHGLDTCISTAFGAGRTIAPEAQLLIAMWINMTGPPTRLLRWIAGSNPGLTVAVPPPGASVDANAVEAYLRATDYYSENPQNFPHLLDSLAAGVEQLSDLHASTRTSPATAPEFASPATPPTPAPPAELPPAGLAPPSLTAPAIAIPRDGYVYEQATGRMFAREDGMNDLLTTGYSGSERSGGKNDPSKQCEQDIGPIPRGSYKIGDPFTGPSPFSLRLTPDPSNHMCGRDGFLIHGDSIAVPGTASEGCIILNRSARERIYQSKLGKLLVVDRLTPA